jgi:hypothetical protein
MAFFGQVGKVTGQDPHRRTDEGSQELVVGGAREGPTALLPAPRVLVHLPAESGAPGASKLPLLLLLPGGSAQAALAVPTGHASSTVTVP